VKPVKRSVALAILDGSNRQRVLVVQRPAEDEDLPNVWGLPASSLKEGESWEDAAHRTGREKLGVQIELGPELQRGSCERDQYILGMRLFEARIVSGEPRVPQPVPGVTQYRNVQWGDAATLRPAAALGSLCCKLFLDFSANY
jgi:ADP-ribose pyrophosphatase YjhB (NUDIX family)